MQILDTGMLLLLSLTVFKCFCRMRGGARRYIGLLLGGRQIMQGILRIDGFGPFSSADFRF